MEMFRHSAEIVELFLSEVFKITVCLSPSVKHAICGTLLPVSACLCQREFLTPCPIHMPGT